MNMVYIYILSIHIYLLSLSICIYMVYIPMFWLVYIPWVKQVALERALAENQAKSYFVPGISGRAFFLLMVIVIDYGHPII